MYLVEADSVRRAARYMYVRAHARDAWGDLAWWLCRWLEAPGLTCAGWLRREQLWEFEFARWWRRWLLRGYFSCRARRRGARKKRRRWRFVGSFSCRKRRSQRALIRRRRRERRVFRRVLVRRVSEQLFEMHPLSMSGGCSQGRADEAPCEIDALLASVGARRRAVVSNDDCGWLALFGGRRAVALQLSEDAVTEYRRALADFARSKPQIAKLFPSSAERDAYADDVADRRWMDALTLHLAAAQLERRIIVVQEGPCPVVVIDPPGAPPSVTLNMAASVIVHKASHFDGVVADDNAVMKLLAQARPGFLSPDPARMFALPVAVAPATAGPDTRLKDVLTAEGGKLYCPVDSCGHSLRSKGAPFSKGGLCGHLQAHRAGPDGFSLVPDALLRSVGFSACGRFGCATIRQTTKGPPGTFCNPCKKRDGEQTAAQPAAPQAAVREQTPAELLLPSLEEIAQRRIKLRTRVPPELAEQWSRILSAALRDVAETRSEAAWVRLLMLPKSVLFLPQRGGRGKQKSALSAAQAAMKRWEKGEPEAVWYETRRHCSDGGASGPAVKDPKAAETRAVRLAREGMFQKAHAALVSRGLCTWSATVHDQLSALHPVGAPVERAAYRTGRHTEAEVEAVYRELRGFKTGSAGGLSGLTADHICAAVDHRESRGTLRNLTAVCNVILAGEVPPAVHPFLCGASLVPLKKNDVGDARPIAVGETLRRLCAKLLCAELAEKVGKELLKGGQVGVGVRMGMEAAVASVASYARRHAGKDRCILKIDFKNAFNTVDRSRFLQMAERVSVGWMPFLLMCYSTPTSLYCHDAVIQSSCGVQQGDPLGPLLFSLAIHEVNLGLRRAHPELRSVWYLDDGTLMGSPEEVARGYEFVAAECRRWGLAVSPGKCEVVALGGQTREDLRGAGLPMGATDRGHATTDPDAPRTCFSRVAGPCFELLGAPIGDKDFCEAWMVSKMEEFRPLLQSLQGMADKQVALSLLRQCGGFCRVVFYMRSVGHTGAARYLEAFDAQVEETLCRVLGSGDSVLPPEARVQAALAIRRGGLGVRWSSDHAEAAVLASQAGTFALCQSLDPEFTWDAPVWCDAAMRYNARVAPHDKIDAATQPTSKVLQRTLSQAIESAAHEGLLSRGDDLSRARLLSTGLPHAGAFISSVPAWELRIPAEAFSAMLRFRLNLEVFGGAQQCDLCDGPLDPFGEHVAQCVRRSDRITRHDAVRDALVAGLSALGLGVSVEPRHVVPGRQKRPGDLVVRAGVLNTLPTCIDVTVVTPSTATVLGGAATTPGYAAGVAEGAKRSKHAQDCAAGQYAFAPFALELYGGLGPAAVGVVQKVARNAAGRHRADRPGIQRVLVARLSAALQRKLGRDFLRRGQLSGPLVERTVRVQAVEPPPLPPTSESIAPAAPRREVVVDLGVDAPVDSDSESDTGMPLDPLPRALGVPADAPLPRLPDPPASPSGAAAAGLGVLDVMSPQPRTPRSSHHRVSGSPDVHCAAGGTIATPSAPAPQSETSRSLVLSSPAAAPPPPASDALAGALVVMRSGLEVAMRDVDEGAPPRPRVALAPLPADTTRGQRVSLAREAAKRSQVAQELRAQHGGARLAASRCVRRAEDVVDSGAAPGPAVAAPAGAAAPGAGTVPGPAVAAPAGAAAPTTTAAPGPSSPAATVSGPPDVHCAAGGTFATSSAPAPQSATSRSLVLAVPAAAPASGADAGALVVVRGRHEVAVREQRGSLPADETRGQGVSRVRESMARASASIELRGRRDRAARAERRGGSPGTAPVPAAAAPAGAAASCRVVVTEQGRRAICGRAASARSALLAVHGGSPATRPVEAIDAEPSLPLPPPSPSSSSWGGSCTDDGVRLSSVSVAAAGGTVELGADVRASSVVSLSSSSDDLIPPRGQDRRRVAVFSPAASCPSGCPCAGCRSLPRGDGPPPSSQPYSQRPSGCVCGVRAVCVCGSPAKVEPVLRQG